MAESAPRSTLVRRVLLACLLAALAFIAVIAVLHTPWVQNAVGRWALGRLQAAGVAAHADRLRYNLLTRHVRADGIRLATQASPQQPFLMTRAIDLTLPWSVLLGRVSFEAIQIDGVHVTLIRRQDGSTNWPTAQPGPSVAIGSIPIRRLLATDLNVAWRDDTLDARADVTGARLDLEPGPQGAEGRLTMARAIQLVWQGRESAIGAQARLSWDGTRLTIASARIESPEVALTGGGAIELLADRFDLALTLALTGSRLAWQGLSDMTLDAALRVDELGVDADRIDVRAAGGTLQARGRLVFDSNAMSRLTVDWRGVNVAQVLAAFAPDARVPIAGEVAGRASASWTALRAGALTASVDATTSTPRVDARRLGLRGKLSLNASGGEWRAAIDQWIDEALHVAGTAGGRVSEAALDQTTLTGRLSADAERAQQLWRVLEKLDVAPRGAPQVLGGDARADLGLSGTIGAPSVDARLTVTDWRQGPVAAITLTSRATLSTDDAQVSALEARVGANVLRGLGSVSFQRDRLSGSVEASLPALDEILIARSSLRPSGTVEMSATLSGRLTSPVVDGRASGRQLGFAGQRADRLEAIFHAAGQTVSVDRLELTQPDGRLGASGSYDARTRTLTGAVDARNLALAPIVAADGATPVAVSARVDAELSASGTIDDPRGEGTVELREAQWEDRRVGRIAGTLRLAGHRLESSLQLPDLFTTATTSLTLSPFGAFVVDGQVVEGDLAVLASRLAVPVAAPVTGTASLTAHVEGQFDELTRSRVTLDLQRFEARVADVPVRATRGGRASWDERGLDAGDFLFDVGRSALRIGGRLGRESGGTIDASLEGTLGDLAEVANVAMTAGSADRDTAWPEVDGRVSVAARVTGTIGRPEIDATARLDEGRLTPGRTRESAPTSGLPPATGITLRASYAAGLLNVTQLDAAWQGASVAATGEAPIGLFEAQLPEWIVRGAPPRAGAGHFTARLDALTPAMLSPWVGATTLAQLGGRSSGTLTVSADTAALASLKGELVLDRGELLVAGVRFEQQRPTRLELQGDSLRIATWEWGGEGNRVSLGGSFGLDARRALDLSADGAIDLRALGAFLPDISTAGRGVLKASVTGTVDAPLVDGRVDLERGDIRLAFPRLIVSDLAGSLLFTRDASIVADLYGSANGGTLSVAGQLAYAGLRPTNGRVAFTGRGMAMALPEALKSQVDADLSLGFDRGDLSLRGDVTVLGGSYREPLSIAGGLLLALQQPDTAIEVDAPSAIEAMTLDVRITTAEDIVVDNNYAQLGLAADVRLRGTVAQPVLAGRAEAREGGRIFLGGNVYQIVGSGAINFSNPSRIEPDLNVTALARVSGHEITLSLKGPPDRLETTLTSPQMTQSAIVALLVTGSDQSDSGDIPTVGRDQLLAYLSGELFGVAGRAVGLDTLRIEPGTGVRFDAGLIATETDPGSRLTFGKQVTREVEVVFSKNLTDSGKFTTIVAYHPRRNAELRVVSEENNDRLYDFRHDVIIGGVSAPAAVVPVMRPRVGAIRFTGEPGRMAGELQRQLSLTTGRTFDFFRWQQDRESLERFCRDRGYLEARVVTRRSEGGSATARTVDLEYEVHLGRRTIVDITGAPRETAMRAAIEEVWSQSVFDAFLIDEATRTARAILIADGYLRATVTVSMEPRGAEETHLVLTIARGPRSSRRRVAFSGHQQIGAVRLEALVRARGLDQTAWLDAAPLERAVTGLYRDEGFLAVTVSAGAPLFDGDTAMLPVTIAEGPVFRVDRIELAGVTSQPADEVRAAFGLQPGAVFTRAATAQAVRALREHYQARGFGRATVTTASRADKDAGSVALTVTVNEGPRQVLRDVVVEGTRRTSSALVSRELRLDVGTPVDPAAWAQARTRLYETGVFRRVDVEAVPIAEASSDAASAEQPMRAQVTLDEWPPLRLRYGFQLDDEQRPASDGRRFRPGVAGDLTYRNLFGRAASAGVAARYTTDFRAARTFATTPSFFGLPLTSNLFLARSREDLGSSERPFVTDKSEITMEQRFRARGRLQFAYGYNFQRNHTFDVNADPDDPLAFDLTVNVARLTVTSLVDTRDDLVDATRGHFFSATLEYGVSALGSDLRFAKQFVDQSYYRTLGRGFVFATAGRLGLARGYGQDLIPSERFFAGGGTTARGYGENSLGPRDFFGDASGGNALLVLNEELRFPIVRWLRGVTFVDAGNTFAAIGDLAFRALRVGAGVGVRVQTPFALLRVDFGAPVHRRTGERRMRWYFGIGQVF